MKLSLQYNFPGPHKLYFEVTCIYGLKSYQVSHMTPVNLAALSYTCIPEAISCPWLDSRETLGSFFLLATTAVVGLGFCQPGVLSASPGTGLLLGIGQCEVVRERVLVVRGWW